MKLLGKQNISSFLFMLILTSCTFWPGYQRQKTIKAICKCEDSIDVFGLSYNPYLQPYQCPLDSLIGILEDVDPKLDPLRNCLRKQGLSEKNIKRIDTDNDLYKMEWCNDSLLFRMTQVYSIRRDVTSRIRRIHID